MRLSPKVLKWLLRCYPPFFFQRIWVKKIYPDFQQMDIKISKSLLNRNLNGTIFGGTIFASVDPIHTLLLDQIFKRKDIKKTVTWLKSAKISYLKPAAKNLIFSVKIAKEDVQKALDEVKTSGKVVREFEISIYDQAGVLCATSINEIYIRDLSAARTKSSTISEPKT
ncbi:YiiD C-terminal domain-containing protein [Sphingobacterium deserti]|nr:YiiD C-terminal domain-containing protein [Sphingobacterium deserti]